MSWLKLINTNPLQESLETGTFSPLPHIPGARCPAFPYTRGHGPQSISSGEESWTKGLWRCFELGRARLLQHVCVGQMRARLSPLRTRRHVGVHRAIRRRRVTIKHLYHWSWIEGS